MWKQRLTLLGLAIVLAIGFSIPFSAGAANGDVKSIEFDDASSVFLYVDHDTHQLKVLATIEGTTTKKDVTTDAVWVSSVPQIVKAEKGLLTPAGKGTAVITAKYKGQTITVNATSDYLFKELKLSADTPVDLDLGAAPLDVNAFAVEAGGASSDVSDSAVWSTSNAAVATVDKGIVKAVGKGSATITAKYKGLSDTLKINVASPYVSLQIEGSASELSVGGEAVALKARAALRGGTFEDVTDKATWTSSNTSVVTVENGKLKAIGAGTAKITAGYLGVAADTQTIVRLPYQVLTVTPQKELSLFTNDAPVQISAFVANDAASRSDVTLQADWTSSNPVSVSVNQGLITPKAVGKSLIKVSYRGLSREIPVTVLPVVSGVRLKAEKISLFKGEVQALPSVVGTNLADEDVDFSQLADWSSDHEDVVKVEKGKLTAGKPGTTKLTVKVKGYTASAQVTVQEKVLVLRPSATNVSLIVGRETAVPTVKALFEDGTEQDVSSLITWKTSSPNLLIKDQKLKALISSKVNLEGTYLNKNVTVPVLIEEPLTGIVVTPPAVDLSIGRSQTLTVKGVYADGKEVNLTGKISWTSSNNGIATVKGAFVKAVAEGTATLTALYQDKPLNVTVTVTPKLSKLQASDTSIKLKAGEAKSIHVQALFENDKAFDITKDAVWSSSNSYIATVSGGTITAVKKGSATIKATYNKKTVSIRVTVN